MKLSISERLRRRKLAKEKLLPAAIKATGRKGFTKTKEALEGKPGITSPTKLSGWLKARAKERGILSKKHPYGKR